MRNVTHSDVCHVISVTCLIHMWNVAHSDNIYIYIHDMNKITLQHTATHCNRCDMTYSYMWNVAHSDNMAELHRVTCNVCHVTHLILIQMCNVTHLNEARSSSHVFFISVTCLLQMCNVTHRLDQIQLPVHVIRVFCMTHSYMRSDSFIFATRLIHKCECAQDPAP